MKNITLTILVMVCAIVMSQAQTIRVLDKTNLQPIVGAVVNDPNGSWSTETNAKGEFEMPNPVPAQILLTHSDFKELVVNGADAISGDKTIYLDPQVVKLNEVVVSSSRFEEKSKDVPQQIEVVTSKDLENMNAQNSGDALAQTGNVFVQKSQLGGGSPVLRGFEANRVLLVVDGIRMNNAIYRAGHLQNVLRLDNNQMDKVEVVFGPGSTIYGSDALGGVMHFHTRKVLYSYSDKSLTSGGAFVRYSTVNSEKTGNFYFNYGTQKFGVMLSATYSDFGDLRQGNLRDPFNGTNWQRLNYVERIDGKDSMFVNSDPNIQVGSGYKQYNVIGKVGFRPNEFQTHTLNIQYSNTGDVNRYDRLQEYSGGNLKYAEWYYGPETMLLAAYQGSFTKANKMYDKFNLSLAYQDIQESRVSRRFNKDSKKYQIEDVNVLSLNADFQKQLGKSELRYGVEASNNMVQSTAYTRDILTEVEAPTATRYPDGDNSMYWAALYLSHNWEINDKLILTDGIRFNYVGLNADFGDTSIMHFPYTSVEQKNSAVTGSLGIIAQPSDSWRIVAFGSTGFRAPNIDDVGKVFDSSPGLLIVPNADLKPEYTYNADLTVEKTFNKTVRVGMTGFYTMAKNLISVQKFQFNGQDSVVYDGTPSAVYAATNADEGYLYGFNFNFAADINSAFSITSNVNYTYGRIKTDSIDTPLDHIPPVYGKTAFILNQKKFRGEFWVMYSGWKRLKDYSPSGEDNLPQATAFGMPSWYTLNLRASYQINSYLRVQAALENILDLNYRVFASGISAPGRNFSITLRGNF